MIVFFRCFSFSFRWLRSSAFWLFTCTFIPFISVAAEKPAIHPSYSAVRSQSTDEGELLLAELNCLACHDADAVTKKRVASKQGPVLGQQGIPLTSQFIRKWLTDPQASKPGSTMPDLLHGLGSAERTSTIDSLVHFLVSEIKRTNGAPVAADEFKIQQGRLLYHQIGCVACHAPQEPTSVIHPSSNAAETAPPDKRAPKVTALAGQSVPLGELARKTTVQ